MPSSYNGWPASQDKHAIGVEPFGDAHGLPFPGGVKGGDVKTVLGYVATQLHYRVEECVAGWDWGYTYKANVNNPSSLSCHASATAIDYNAPLHPNGSGGTFTDAQVGEIYAILDEVQGAVDWLEGYDEMHFEIAVDAATLAIIAASLPSGAGPAPEPEPPKEWDELATQQEVMQACNDATINVLRSAEAQQIIRDQVAGVLRAEEFNLTEGGQGATVNETVLNLLRAQEFQLSRFPAVADIIGGGG